MLSFFVLMMCCCPWKSWVSYVRQEDITCVCLCFVSLFVSDNKLLVGFLCCLLLLLLLYKMLLTVSTACSSNIVVFFFKVKVLSTVLVYGYACDLESRGAHQKTVLLWGPLLNWNPGQKKSEMCSSTMHTSHYSFCYCAPQGFVWICKA